MQDSVLPRGVGLRKPHISLPPPLFSLLTPPLSFLLTSYFSPLTQPCGAGPPFLSPQAFPQKEKPALSHRLFGIG